jgi:lia operon protein LiaG
MIKPSLALLAVALPLQAQSVDHRTLSSPAAIYDIAGSIHVVRGTGNDITIDITRGGRDADKLSIATGEIGDRQTLRVLFPSDRVVFPWAKERGHWRNEMEINDDGTWGGNHHWRGRRVTVVPSGDGLEARADLTIHMPPGARLAIYLGVGDASASGTDGDLLADVDDASVTIDHTHGALDLDTGSGDVIVRDAQGDVKLDAGSGDVTLSNLRGDRLDVDAGSGDIKATSIAYPRAKLDLGSGKFDLAGATVDELSLDAGSGDVEVAFTGPARRVKIDAGSGDVTLHIPKNFGADVDIEAGSGDVRSDFALERRRDEDESHYRGRIGDGNGQISIDGGSGQIALVKQP